MDPCRKTQRTAAVLARALEVLLWCYLETRRWSGAGAAARADDSLVDGRMNDADAHEPLVVRLSVWNKKAQVGETEPPNLPLGKVQ
mgnify:CR=1 FL=1